MIQLLKGLILFWSSSPYYKHEICLKEFHNQTDTIECGYIRFIDADIT